MPTPILADLSDVVAEFAAPRTVTRASSASSYDANGRPVAGGTTTITVNASVQPTSGRDLQLLPEGERTKESLTFFATSELRTSDPETGTPADRVAYGSKNYEIQSVQDWSELAGYWRAVGMKVEV